PKRNPCPCRHAGLPVRSTPRPLIPGCRGERCACFRPAASGQLRGPVARGSWHRWGHGYRIVNRGGDAYTSPSAISGGFRICDPASLTAITTLTLPGRAGGIFSHEEPIP